jgi:hypothetical protein
LLYRLISSWLRRAAAAMAVIALLFGVVAGWSGLRYLDVKAQAKAIKEASIVQGFGIRVPIPPDNRRHDPGSQGSRLRRTHRLTEVIALSTLAGALIARPPARPAGAEGARTG